MLSDLSVTTMIGAVVLLGVAAVMYWVGRDAQEGRLRFGGRLSIRTKATRHCLEALVAGNRAAGPFLQRYAMLVAGCAVLVMLSALVSDVLAVILHGFAILLLVLAALVCVRKTEAGASAVTPVTEAEPSAPEEPTAG